MKSKGSEIQNWDSGNPVLHHRHNCTLELKQEHLPRTFHYSNLPLIMSQKYHSIFLATLDHDLLDEARHLTIAFFPTLPKITVLLIRLN